MTKYNHMKLKEREMLLRLLKDKKSIKEIAIELSRHKSTIYRELRRNTLNVDLGYIPDRADKAAQERKATRLNKLLSNSDLMELVVSRLKDRWSPEMIAGRLKQQRSSFMVCHETIYQFVYSEEGKKQGLYKYLLRGRPGRRMKGARKMSKPIIPNRTSIHERPPVIEKRKEFGHYEGDLTFFRGSQSSNITALLERKTRYVLMIKNGSKKATEVMKGIFNKIRSLPKVARRSITFVNGGEFAKHNLIRDYFGVKTFFCDPRSPWQKGQVESFYAMLHRYLPKKESINSVSEDLLIKIQEKMNNLPRKCLGFKTPKEVFFKCVALQT